VTFLGKNVGWGYFLAKLMLYSLFHYIGF